MDSIAFQRNSILAYALGRLPSFIIADHHVRIAQHLAAFAEGKIKRLIITAPPRHTKSMLCAEFFPPWYMGKRPDQQIIYATYGQDLSRDFGRKVKNQMLDPEYMRVFPECRVVDDSKSYKSLSTSKRGAYTATSIGGPVTGKGADRLIIDDPIKDSQTAQSQVYRDMCWDWYITTARTRLQPGGGVLVISTRWHEDDLTGRILKGDDGEWTHLYLPALSESDDALWPEWMPTEALLDIKKDIGAYQFEALYMGRPSPPDSGFLKTKMINTVPPFWLEQNQKKSTILSMDTATKTGTMNDFSVITAWKQAAGQKVNVDCMRQKLEFPELKRKAAFMVQKWKPSAILIEDKSSGTQLIQEFRRTGWPIIQVKPTIDKVTRALPLAAQIEAGNISILEGMENKDAVLHELAMFPNGKNDDCVDSYSMAIDYMSKKTEAVVIDHVLAF